MELAVFRDIFFGTAGGGGVLYLLWRIIQRMGSGEKAATARSDAEISMIERLERHIERAEERATAATERADKAEQERNGALLQIERLTMTIDGLRTEVQNLKTQVEAYAQRTGTT